MYGCGDVQNLVLDHLYGLLAPEETQSLLAHLDGCSACQAALATARRHQQQIGRAARRSFPEVRFSPPNEATSPTVPFAPKPTPRAGRVLWATAAALLLAVVGLGSFSLRILRSAENERVVLAAHSENLEQMERILGEARSRWERLPQEEATLKAQVQARLRERTFNVVVTGPATARVGAPSDYVIQTRTPTGLPTTARLEVRVVDDKGTTILEQKNVVTTGEHRLRLGPDLPLAPGTALALEVSARREGDQEPAAILRERIDLAGPSYLTHLATDRPIYHPGDTVYFRSLTLERFRLRPAQEELRLIYSITGPLGEKTEILRGLSTLERPGGAPVLGPDGKPLQGLGSGFWRLAPDAPGGEYQITVREAEGRFAPESRGFLVHRYQTGPFRKTLDLDRASYGPGDPVVARLRATRPDGTPLVGAKVQPVLTLDGHAHGPEGRPGTPFAAQTTDAEGQVTVAWVLPREPKFQQGILSVTFAEKGGASDTLVRTIPLVHGGIRLELYPEGGDLVAGVPARVYFQVRSATDRPVEARGRLLDDKNQVVTEVATFHDEGQPRVNQGRGLFSFTPRPGGRYRVVLEGPGSVSADLPEIKSQGVVLSTPQGITRVGEPVRLTVHGTGSERRLLIGLYARGRLLDHRETTVRADEPMDVALTPREEVGGVMRITVFEDRSRQEAGQRELVPLAERLVFREAERKLNLQIRPERGTYLPGERVNLTLTARNEKDQPTGAVVLLRVLDRQTLALTPERTSGSLPGHFLLASEVRRGEDLEQADVLLGEGPTARMALDLLLGTQGWRRFAEQDPGRFFQQQPRDAERILASVQPMRFDFQRRERERVTEEILQREEEARGEVDSARRALLALAETPVGASLERWRGLRDTLDKTRTLALPVLLGLLLGIAILLGVLRHRLSLSTVGPAVGLWGVAALLLLLVAQKGVLGPENPLLDEVAGRNQALAEIEKAQALLARPRRGRGEMANVAMASLGPPLKARGPLGVPERLPLPGMSPTTPENVTPGPRPPGGVPLVIREYAHKNSPKDGASRRDFAEMLLWQPAVVIPDKGSTTVSFELSDSTSAFEIVGHGHTLDGRIGSANAEIVTRLPVSLDIRTPTEMAATDQLDLPVTAHNATNQARRIRLRVTAVGLTVPPGKAEAMLDVPAQGTAQYRIPITPERREGAARLEVRALGELGQEDAVVRNISLKTSGFPITEARSDLLDGKVTHDLDLPQVWEPGSLRCQLQLYPTTLSTIRKGLEGLLREPHGCFEQTSAANYPNLLILDSLRQSGEVRPEVEAHARTLLAQGYQRLLTFECPQTGRAGRQGFDWFGRADAAHEALTAYALLQFRDMARVHSVDSAVLERTRAWLMASRNGRGGFVHSRQGIDTFGRAPDDITDAYIVWAITESGREEDVTRELEALSGRAREQPDPYLLSLIAGSLLNRGQSAEAVELLNRLAQFQKPDGALDAERTSITGSSGGDLRVETTALALLGWLKVNQPARFTEPVRRAITWLIRQRQSSGLFGATQATVLALKALLAHARLYPDPSVAGELRLYVGDTLATQCRLIPGASEVITVELPDPERRLRAGRNVIRAEITSGGRLPHTLSWSYVAAEPKPAEACAVRLTTRLEKDVISQGATTVLRVGLENPTERPLNMPMVVIGIPAGLVLPEDLKELRTLVRGTGPLGAFETRERELILYGRGLAPRQEVEIPLTLIARYSGRWRGPASRAYLYYDGTHRWWTPPLEAAIGPGQAESK